MCSVALTIAAFMPYERVFADEILENEPFAEVFSADECRDFVPPAIEAGAAIVVDAESGRILYEKNAYSRKAMASTTKIMTAIIALENGRLDDVVTVSKRAASIRGSTINLREGQKMTLREMLYGLMLNSGNDAAIAIAEHVGGSVEGFIDMMNRKAAQVGARDTHFMSPHGLDADGHYSTAYDLAVITRYALQNPLFSEIVGTRTVSIQTGDLRNTNEMLSIYPGADGVKTGYTGKAGRCLVTSATRDGWRIISVVLNCATRYKRAKSSKLILDYAFNSYKPYKIQKAGDIIRKLPVVKGIENLVDIKASEEISIPLKDVEAGLIETKVHLPDKLDAPVYAGVSVGHVQYLLNGKAIAESELAAWSDVRRKGFLDHLGDVFKAWCKMMREGMFYYCSYK